MTAKTGRPVGQHNTCCDAGPFSICTKCGKRGQNCFAEPLGPKTAAALEALLEAIESCPTDTFRSDIWHVASRKCSHAWYGTSVRMLNWLEHVGVIECVKRSRSGNIWKRK